MQQNDLVKELENVSERPYSPVPLSVKRKAIQLVLATEYVPDDVFDAISNYIDKSFKCQTCCVMYSVSKKFLALCKNLNVDIGTREVVINSSHNILFTKDYITPPTQI